MGPAALVHQGEGLGWWMLATVTSRPKPGPPTGPAATGSVHRTDPAPVLLSLENGQRGSNSGSPLGVEHTERFVEDWLDAQARAVPVEHLESL